jgi:hypothetical protein
MRATIDLRSEANVFPPSWFTDPQFSEVTPVRVNADGHITGHFTYWPQMPYGQEPPRSPSGYTPFHRWDLTTSGTTLRVGLLSERAEQSPSARFPLTTAEEIDATRGVTAAAVRVGEDAHGIWVAGAASPYLTEACAGQDQLWVSGHWVREAPSVMELLDLMLIDGPASPVKAVLNVLRATRPDR